MYNSLWMRAQRPFWAVCARTSRPSRASEASFWAQPPLQYDSERLRQKLALEGQLMKQKIQCAGKDGGGDAIIFYAFQREAEADGLV